MEGRRIREDGEGKQRDEHMQVGKRESVKVGGLIESATHALPNCIGHEQMRQVVVIHSIPNFIFI